MTDPVFDAGVYTQSSQRQVLDNAPKNVEPVGSRTPKAQVWMNHRMVQATVATLAVAAITYGPLNVEESRGVVDRRAVWAETSIDDRAPAWITPVTNRLNGYLELGPGWDSYGAPVISRESVESIVSALESLVSAGTPAPSVAPTPEGGVQVEWHERGVDLELRSDATGCLYAFFQERSRGKPSWDAELPNPSIAAPWFERIAGDEKMV